MKHIIAFISFASALQLAITFAFNEEKYTPFYKKYDTYEFSAECTQAGLMCANCTTVVNCIQTEGDHFLAIGVKTCDTEQQEYCVVSKKDCRKDPNPRCTGNVTFECHNTGVFPDPIDCRVFHICVEEVHNLEENVDSMKHIGVKCDDGYGYNPVTTYCDELLKNGACLSASIIDLCKFAGDIGPVADTSIFYVCTQNENDDVLPQLYMCPHGTRFENGACADVQKPHTTMMTTTTSK